jgi:putative transposase
VSRKRVERLMRQAGISGLVRRKRARTTVSVPGVRVADDLVERRFRAAERNVLWIADVTYLRTWEGWLYLAAVQDAYSRGSSAGRWPITCAQNSSSTRSRWRSRAGAPHRE